MELSIGSRLKNAWNAFTNRDPTRWHQPYGSGYSRRPDRPRLSRGNERSIITSIFNRIALDVASVGIKRCRLDKNGRYIEDINSGLNECLNLEANIDQTGRAFIQDVVMSMLDEGCVAIVPVDTTADPKITNSYDILSMRTGKILEWYPAHVKVRIYNDRTGEKEDIMLTKKQIAIIENPLYAVVNEPNSNMQRLIRKLRLLDVTDEQTASGKLDLIIQLPYVVKTDARREQAERRRKDIESQLAEGKYGIAYTDGTEKVTQLNRSVENNLMKTIEYLTNELYTQLGFTPEIMNGTADENAMTNYYSRTIEPCVSAVTEELARKYLTKAARNDKQAIKYFRDPFKLVSITALAELVDKFTRNEVMSSNEWRQIVGLKPSSDPRADELRNKNLSQSSEDIKLQNGVEKKDTNNKEGGKDTNGV